MTFEQWLEQAAVALQKEQSREWGAEARVQKSEFIAELDGVKEAFEQGRSPTAWAILYVSPPAIFCAEHYTNGGEYK